MLTGVSVLHIVIRNNKVDIYSETSTYLPPPPSLSPSISAGVGRTGCFIVIDAMLERMKHEKSVDIYGHVTCMRAQRNYMVQTEDQYIFIHEALLEAATCGNTEVPARNLYAHIQKLTQPPPGETVTAMELEFKVTDQQHLSYDWRLFLRPCLV